VNLPRKRLPKGELYRLLRVLDRFDNFRNRQELDEVDIRNCRYLSVLIKQAISGDVHPSVLYREILSNAVSRYAPRLRLRLFRFMQRLYRDDTSLSDIPGLFEMLSNVVRDGAEYDVIRQEVLRTLFFMPTAEAPKDGYRNLLLDLLLESDSSIELRIQSARYLQAIIKDEDIFILGLITETVRDKVLTPLSLEFGWIAAMFGKGALTDYLENQKGQDRARLTPIERIAYGNSVKQDTQMLSFLVHEIASAYALYGLIEGLLPFFPQIRLRLLLDDNVPESLVSAPHSIRAQMNILRRHDSPLGSTKRCLAYFDPVLVDGAAYFNLRNTVSISYEPWKYNKATLSQNIGPIPEELAKELKDVQGPIVVAGSLAGPELYSVSLATAIIGTSQTPPPFFVIVPREIDNSDDASWFKKGLDVTGIKARAVPGKTSLYPYDSEQSRVLVVTESGVLASLYAKASIAIIGGGCGGGHNPIEAARFGAIPIVDRGMKRNRLAQSTLLKNSASIEVSAFDDADDLPACALSLGRALASLLSSPDRIKGMRLACGKTCEELERKDRTFTARRIALGVLRSSSAHANSGMNS
jgi:hypothetical protein